MIKFYKVSYLFILLLLLCNIAFAGNSSVLEGNGKGELQLPFVVKEILEENKNLNYKIEVHYPQLENYSDSKIQKDFNDTIYNYVNTEVENFRKEMETWTPVPELDVQSFLSMEYSLEYELNNIVSIRFLNDLYFSGSAHGSHMYWPLNYDLLNNKIINLSDLFMEKSDYLVILSDYCREDLMKRSDSEELFLDEEWVSQGTGPEEETFQCFNLKDSGILITFNEYQVAPYAAGPQEVNIPYNHLEVIINPDGPAGFSSK